jgi:hypothetical protein
MDIREVVSEFKNVAPLAGLADAWHWSPAPGINFAGALSADGARLLQLSTKPGFAEELARRTLEFAREHEQEMAARNPYMAPSRGSPRRTASPSTPWLSWRRRCTASTRSSGPS